MILNWLALTKLNSRTFAGRDGFSAIATFFELYPFVVQTMQAMSTRSDSERGWDGETVTKASGCS